MNNKNNSSKILQWNSGRTLDQSGLNELIFLLSSTGTAIALIQEIQTPFPRLPPNWKIFISGQSAIITHSSVSTITNTKFTTNFPCFSSMAINAKLPSSNSPITIISTYRSPNRSNLNLNLHPFIEWLSETCASLPLSTDNFIIAGDFNIHSSKFGDPRNGPGSEELNAIIEALEPNGTALNTGIPTRIGWPNRNTTGNSSMIDLTIAYSKSKSFHFSNWSTNGQGRSDHQRITFEVTSNSFQHLKINKSPHDKSLKLIPENINEETSTNFAQMITDNLITKGWDPAHLSNSSPFYTVDMIATSLSEIITETAISIKFLKTSKPPKSKTPFTSPNPAWSEECTELLYKRRKIHKKLKYLRTLPESPQTTTQLKDTKKLWNKKCNDLSSAIKQNKNRSWTAVTSLLTVNTPSDEAWRIIKKLGNNSTHKPKRKIESIILEDQDGIQFKSIE